MGIPVIPVLFAGGWYPEFGETMMRQFSHTLFGLALGSALMMKFFSVHDELVGLAVISVLISAILTNLPFAGCFAMWPRSIGIAGISGLSLVYMKLGGCSLPGTILTVLTAILLSSAVLLAIFADFSESKQGENKQDEV